jgi:hypothetical protein
MNRRATIVFAATWLVLGRIPDQPGAGSHRLQQTASLEGLSLPALGEESSQHVVSRKSVTQGLDVINVWPFLMVLKL